MKSGSHIFMALLFSASLMLVTPAQRAVAQESPDDKPHIQPRSTPTPSPTPGQKSQKQDQYDRPPFPGDSGKPEANEPSPKANDQVERPPFPGDAPGSSPTGESSSRDSQ